MPSRKRFAIPTPARLTALAPWVFGAAGLLALLIWTVELSQWPACQTRVLENRLALERSDAEIRQLPTVEKRCEVYRRRVLLLANAVQATTLCGRWNYRAEWPNGDAELAFLEHLVTEQCK